MVAPSKSRVAVIDDDSLVLAIIDDALGSAGYSVAGYRTAEEALADLWDRGTDLVITDVLLPRMSGLDLVRELRCRPWGGHVPVVAISALRWDQDQLGSLKQALQPCAVLTKPFQTGEVLSTVQELLATSTAPDAPAPLQWPSRSTPLIRPSTAELRAVGKERVKLQVALETPHELMSEFTQSLMHDGLFVPSYHPLPVDTEVEVLLTLPFRPELKLTGKVVQSIDLDSPEGLTRGPGMAIALYDLPKDVKRELKAYVAGLRAGSAGSVARPDRAVVLAGLRGMASTEAANFLRRSAIRTVHTADLALAIEMIKRSQPLVVAIHSSLMGNEPRPWLAALHAAGARMVIVVAPEKDVANLPLDLPSIHVVTSSRALLAALASRMEVAPRTAARVPLNVDVRATRPDGSVGGVLQNLSLGGVMLLTEAACAVGERLQVEFELPDGQGSVRGILRTLRVGRKGAGNEVLVAAVFERLEADATEALRRYLEDQAGPAAYRFLGNTFS